MRALLATAGLLAVAGTGAAQAASIHARHKSTGEPVYALAQDGHLMAWLASGGGKCNGVHVSGLDGLRTVPQPSAESMTCHWNLSENQPQLALAARASAVLWTLHEDGASPFDYVLTGRIGGPEQRVDRLAHTEDGIGLWLGGVAGAGRTLAYSFVDVEYVDKLSCLAGGSCGRQISDGGIQLVSEGEADPLPGAGPALELAAAAGRLAYVQASRVRHGAPAANGSAPIEVVSATTGAAVSDVQPDGVPLAIALSPRVLAVLTYRNRHDRISWYDPRNGTMVGSIRLLHRAAPQLAASNRVVVYRIGRWLRGIAVDSGRIRKLAHTSGVLAGLSLQGNRLAWAEDNGGTGRIRTLTVH